MEKISKLRILGFIAWFVVALLIVAVFRLHFIWAMFSLIPIYVVVEFLVEKDKEIKIRTLRLVAFGMILLPAYLLVALNILPPASLFLVFPLMATADFITLKYAKRRGIILVDERMEMVYGKAAFWGYQLTLGLIFVLLFLFEFYQIQIQTSHLLIFLGGYMGLIYLAISFLYEWKHGTLWRVERRRRS